MSNIVRLILMFAAITVVYWLFAADLPPAFGRDPEPPTVREIIATAIMVAIELVVLVPMLFRSVSGSIQRMRDDIEGR